MRHFLETNVPECPCCQSADLTPVTKGNRTGKWFRQCRRCGASLVIATMPEEPPRAAGRMVVALPLEPDPQPEIAPVQRRFTSFEVPAHVRAVMNKARHEVERQR
jgi:hypothetical protein